MFFYTTTMSFNKLIYDNTHYSNIYISNTTATIFDVDLNNLTLEKIEIRLSDGELITSFSKSATVDKLVLDYTIIKNNIEKILIDYRIDRIIILFFIKEI